MRFRTSSRRQFLGLVGTSYLSLPAFLSQVAGPRPNLILINVDDLGWADVGCFGSRYYETPNIDRLAAQGMKFTNAYANAALCSPTRASMMTGRYPTRHGVTDWIRARWQSGYVGLGQPEPAAYDEDPARRLATPVTKPWLELSEITIAEALQSQGYKCCHIGKWHLGPEGMYPENQGFDLNIGGCDYGEPPSYFEPWRRPANKFWPEPEINGMPTLSPRKEGEYLTDREADEAVQFIRENAGRPFFLNMCHYAVHFPIEAKEEMIEKYKRKKSDTKQNVPAYAAMVESVDQAVGQIMKTLDELHLAEKTLVMFTSDNGGLIWPGVATDNAPLRDGKGTPYEGGIRVPLIVRFPGAVKEAAVCEEPVASIDIFPTFCEAAQARVPGDRVIDGESLFPLFQGGRFKRDALFWHYPHYRGTQSPYCVVRAGKWKLIRFYEGPRLELYNLAEDGSERRDLAGQMTDTVKQLENRLDRWLSETGARLPRPNPGYHPLTTGDSASGDRP